VTVFTFYHKNFGIFRTESVNKRLDMHSRWR